MPVIDILLIIIRLAGTVAIGLFLKKFLFVHSNLRSTLIISVAAGLAINALLFFWVSYFNVPLLVLDFIQVTAMAIILIKGRSLFNLKFKLFPAWDSPLNKFYYLALIVALAFIVSNIIWSPYGHWDAFAIWNLKAKLMAFNGLIWDFNTQNILYYSHSDYPLLLPSAIAYIQSNQTSIWLSIFFTFSIPFVFLGIGKFSEQRWVFASLAFLVNLAYLKQGAGQYADIPLSFFLTSSIICLNQFIDSADSKHLIVSGFLIGCCCWIKNEGWMYWIIILFLLVIFSISKKEYLKTLSHLKWYILGGLPFTFTSMFFKRIVAVENDLFVAADQNSISNKLFDVERYHLIMKEYGKEIFNFSGTAFQPAILFAVLLIVLLITKTKLKQESIHTYFLIPFITISFIGFTVIYLITPHDLQWHLNTSLSRLLTQLYPVFVLTIFIALPATIFSSKKKPN